MNIYEATRRPAHAYDGRPSLHGRDWTETELDARDDFMEGFGQTVKMDRTNAYLAWLNRVRERESSALAEGRRFSAAKWQEDCESEGFERGVEEGRDYLVILQRAIAKANPFPKGRW